MRLRGLSLAPFRLIPVCSQRSRKRCSNRTDRTGQSDLLAVDCSESGYEVSAGGGQSEVVSEEQPVRKSGNDSFHIERAAREANLVAPVRGIGWGTFGRCLALDQPTVRRKAGIRVVNA